MSPSTTLLRASSNVVRSAHAWLSEGWVRVDAQRSCCALAAAQGNVVCAREMCERGGRATFNHGQYLEDRLLGRFDGRIRPRRRRARRRRARRARAMEKGWCPTATNTGNRAQVAPMAAFLLAVSGQLVTASGWEWCKSTHTIVISVARTLLKSGLRAPWSKYHLPRFCHTHVSDRANIGVRHRHTARATKAPACCCDSGAPHTRRTSARGSCIRRPR
jgi:hypothetical protein